MKIATKYSALAAATLFAFFAAPAALATDLTDIGYVDQAAIGNIPQFVAAQQQVQAYGQQLNNQFNAEVKRARTDADKQRLAAEFRQKLSDKQNEVLGPLFARAQTAIAQVASNKGITVVIDKRIVIYGGQNITDAVLALIKSPGAVVPPVSTPPPAEIGFVDQSQLDQIPKVKSASDDFLKFATDQRSQLQAKMAKAKTDAERQQLIKDTDKTISDRQDQSLKPLIDQTRNAMADVARKKNLILVVDRQDVIYGGTDITSDVQNAIK